MESSSHQRNEGQGAFSEIEPHGLRRKIDESSRLFDVFINHRGPDVKQTLALQLYNFLSELGIHAFLDSEEKELGDSFPSTIENAIHSASAHTAIFSEGYAESPWCLAELALMLQSRAKIIPVFYEVKPSALRYIEKGEYASAFAGYKLSNRYTEKLKEWEEALRAVSFITGYEISSNFNISDCQNIVSAIHKEVQRKKSLHVAKYPVGLPRLVSDFERQCLVQHVEDFERQCRTNEDLEIGREKAQIVGIFGMGGVGKTTLAKELFNRKHSQYRRACFLFDVREASANNTFPFLQMRFIRDLFQQDHLSFQCVEEGKSHIADCIKKSNQLSFLIVLDDIDNVQQLDALLIFEMLKKSVGSLVIVTSRDVGVLTNTGITIAYNLQGIDRYEARELFCWHAFGQSYAPWDYENLVSSFLNVCRDIPLSLQVLGSHVHGTDQKYWRLELNKVRKKLPRDIYQRLKISFDALDYEEQQIFMDIACFFVDKLKNTAIEIWEASGWSGQHALQTLKNKFLVQETEGSLFEEEAILRMHDHLRDLGREIANRQSRQCRLWRPQDLIHLESRGFRNILSQTKGRCFHSLFERSMNCRITYFIGESDVSADTSTFLLWLELEYQGFLNQRSTCIPSWIPLQNLRCLKISNLSPKTLFSDRAQFQGPARLKELQIYNTSFLQFSDSSAILDSLEKIQIGKCNRISGLSALKNLVELQISNCLHVEELSVVSLNCLETIVLYKCYNLKTVLGISDIRKLVELNISGCPKFEQLRLVGLNNLKCITFDISFMPAFFELDDCRNLKTISGKLNAEKLVIFKITDCPNLELLLSLKGPNNLETVKIDGYMEHKLISIVRCGKMKSITLPTEFMKSITLPTEFMELRIEECRELETVAVICHHSKGKGPSNFAPLSCLKRITIKSCSKLHIIQGMHELNELEIFNLFDCPKLEELTCGPEACVEKISIVRCGKMKSITLPTKFMELRIEECRELETVAVICDHSEAKGLSNFARLSCLKRITIKNCSKLQFIQGLRELNKLGFFILSDCPELEELTCYGPEACVEKISIGRCGKMKSMTLPTNFMELRIEECRELETLAVIWDHNECKGPSNFARLSCLKRITIKNCSKLHIIQGMHELNELGFFNVFDCPELEELTCCGPEACVEKISIGRCGKMKTITLPTKLVELRIEECRELRTATTSSDHCEFFGLWKLSSVARLQCLKMITIRICDKLQTMNGIEELHALEYLELFNCPEFKELPCSAFQTCLKKISIVRCWKLQRLYLPKALVELILEGCAELKIVATACDHSEFLGLQELSSVARLNCLKRIRIHNCDKLQTIEDIDEFLSLESLELVNCPELEELTCSSLQTCLEKINILRCGKMQNIILPTTLVDLRIADCRELRTVAVTCNPSELLKLPGFLSVDKLSRPKSITIQTCDKLQSIQGIDELPALKSLQLINCPELGELPCLMSRNSFPCLAALNSTCELMEIE